MTTTDARRSSRLGRPGLLGLAVLAVLALWLLGRLGPTSSETRSVDLGPGTSELHVAVGTGSVRLTPAEGDELRVDRTVRRGWRGPDVEERTDGLRAVVEASCPTLFGGRCEVHYEIAVPDGHAVEVAVDSGDLEVSGLRVRSLRTSASSGRTTLADVDGPIELRASSGSVSATGLRSDRVTAEISSGSTQLEFAAAPTEVTVSASSGDVTLRLPADGDPYHVRARSSSGQQRVDVPTDPGSPRTVTVTVSSGDVEVLPR
jgi:putative adhesin